MSKKKRGRSSKSKKPSYYKPPKADEKLLHKLLAGTPTHNLLRSFHKKDELSDDVREIAEAANLLHEATSLLKKISLNGLSKIDEVIPRDNMATTKIREFVNDAPQCVDSFMAVARSALLTRLTEVGYEEGNGQHAD